MSEAAPHIPVLLDEVLDALAIAPGETHVDGTFGAGGYSRAMAAKGARVIAFDRDPDAIREGQDVANAHDILLIAGEFSRMRELLAEQGIESVSGLTLDIGVSSMQLDRADRGFSFQADGPLDMTMRQLASVVRRALGHKPHDKKDPATRTFQAIRIHVNRELEELERGLEAAEALLEEGGRLAIVTFHSLEDRIVKQFLRNRSGGEGGGSRHMPEKQASAAPTFAKPAKAVRASEAELARNPRARSATLRSAIRTAAPVSSSSSARSAHP